MKGRDTRDFVIKAAHYTSPEIEMFETRKEIAGLQNENRIRAALLAAAMYMMMIQIKIRAAISVLKEIYERSSAERRGLND